jgi:diguanylate cyclase (GGDEF)-like protein
LLFIDVVGLKGINLQYGREVGDEVLRHIARNARAGLRLADILFRSSSDEFVALLSKTDGATATVVAERVHQNIRNHMLRVKGGMSVCIETEITCVSAPHDGQSLQELVAAAQLRVGNPRRPSSQVH